MLGPWVEPGRWPAYSLWWSQQQRLFQDAICYFILLRVMRAALLTPLTLPAGPLWQCWHIWQTSEWQDVACHGWWALLLPLMLRLAAALCWRLWCLAFAAPAFTTLLRGFCAPTQLLHAAWQRSFVDQVWSLACPCDWSARLLVVTELFLVPLVAYAFVHGLAYTSLTLVSSFSELDLAAQLTAQHPK